MSKVSKRMLLAGTVLILLGSIILAFTACSAGWDPKNLGTAKYETNTHEISKSFDKISMNTDTADIDLLPSDDSSCRVVCHESSKTKHEVSVSDGTLTITEVDTRKWYDYISIGFNETKITLYLPEENYSSLKINESTGDIAIPEDLKFESIDIELSTGDVKCFASATGAVNITASTGSVSIENASMEALDISVNTGNIDVANVNCGILTANLSTGKAVITSVACESFTSEASTGDVTLEKVQIANNCLIERSTGDVKLKDTIAGVLTVTTDTGEVNFESSDAAEITVKTDTGKVHSSLLTEKVFIIRTDTGKIDVPESISGGKCKITTDTGDIRITLG